ncbi:13813_t:CDS:2 [Entrophospora sp. SA101]|nr:15132_t:CDS:2 [Entrophospora sp. SA101]CAJ0644997.1 13813_t:CDS:2 [Entrophospora sp. SA101]CAJ0831934.1 1220_t:CDS:2 [Entrophospora sp. SA101]CAJ0903101.1 14192_t:CDS:2 [Entrophospora sp. SA101]CAJ0919489.1 13266_t:CDS:2 [Entrophospora sp. SA101]
MTINNEIKNSLVFKLVEEQEVEKAFQLELKGYPIEEAATFEKLQYRQKHAPNLFLGDSTQIRMIGFVVSTLTRSKKLTEESMSTHESDGKTICIHSVCIDKNYQRLGIATSLLKEYIERILLLNNNDDVKKLHEKICLIAHKELIPLYEKVGFKLIGESEVVHGNEKWFDLEYEL